MVRPRKRLKTYIKTDEIRTFFTVNSTTNTTTTQQQQRQQRQQRQQWQQLRTKKNPSEIQKR